MPALSPVLPIVERCQALFDDLDLNAVKEWKAKAPGRSQSTPIVGFGCFRIGPEVTTRSAASTACLGASTPITSRPSFSDISRT